MPAAIDPFGSAALRSLALPFFPVDGDGPIMASLNSATATNSDSRAAYSFDKKFRAAALPGTREPLSAQQVERWVWILIGIGIAARAVRYLLRFPLWEDECFVAVSLMDRGYAELMQPLEYHQVAPLLFLWVQKTAITWFGFNEYSLRLLAFGSGIASLFLFRHIAKRLTSGMALVLATAIFAVAYPGIRYAAEAKPYGSDLLVGLVITALTVEWLRRPEQSRWLWLLAAFAPFAVGLSYPAAFVGGSASLLIAWVLLQAPSRGGWTAWVAFNLTLVGGFVGFYLLTGAGQSAAEHSFMAEFWRDALPPLTQPWKLIPWFFNVHAGAVLGYPIGGANGASAATFGLVAVAVFRLWRDGWRAWLAFCLLPLALNFVAAAVQRYPYGGHVKFVHYTAATICLLAGYGLAVALDWGARHKASCYAGLRTATVVLACIAVGTMLRDFWRPCKTLSDMRHRDFARCLWFNLSFEGETACVTTDLKQVFSQPAMQELNWTAMYLCNQRIYSPRHQRGEAIDLAKVTAEHPLRCVLFKTALCPHDEAAQARWVAEMRERYDLASHDVLPFPYFNKNERDLGVMDHVEIYKFTPKQTTATAAGTMLLR